MEYVTLGKTGLKVSRVGLGGIPIQRIDAEAAKKLLDAVEAAGINYIDSARGYSVSEELIGQAIEGRREKFVLATKTMSRDKEGMARDIEISLKNFRTDYIDLYQVHNPSLRQLEQVCAPGGALEALVEARAAGKIGHTGLTAHSPEVFERALELDWVETVMFPYNIVETQAAELMERARKRDVGFINMKSLSGGAIEDARLAIRFAAANPNVTVVLPGMYSPEEVAENVAAASDPSPLSVEELEKVEKLRRELGSSMLLITHDLGVVANIADRVAVLYAGQIIELGAVEEVFYDPRHPYTWALLSSLPQLAQQDTKLYSIAGTPPSLYKEIVGDAFAPRNPYCMKIDTLLEPPMFRVTDTHYAKTWLLDPDAPRIEKPEGIRDIHEKLLKAFNI